MNKNRIHNIIQYALLVAGQEDDFTDRDLGPIHFIKYVYLADLNHAKYNKGETYTGIQWKFHNFGPWSNEVNNCIEPALDEIGAYCKTLPSQYDSCDDYKRWSLSDDRLLENLGIKLPITVSGAVADLVHKFKKDTPSLLEHVYKTGPMLKAAPGESLDFSSVGRPEKEKIESSSKWNGLTLRKKKKFQQAMQAIRAKRKTRKGQKKKGFVPSPLPNLHDDVYFDGLDWVDSLAGEALVSGSYEAKFSDSVWHSKTREDLPVAAMSLKQQEIWTAYRAKKRPCIVLGKTRKKVDQSVRRNMPRRSTEQTLLVVPYYGADQDGTRAGYNPELVERIRHIVYPQFYIDMLPIGGPRESVARFDQLQPVGRMYNSYETTGFKLSADALLILDEVFHLYLHDEVSESGDLIDFLDLVKEMYYS